MTVYNCGIADNNAKPQVFKDAYNPEYNGFLYYETHSGVWKDGSLYGDCMSGFITNGKSLFKVFRSWMNGDPWLPYKSFMSSAWEIEAVKGFLVVRAGDEKVGRPNQIMIVQEDTNTLIYDE